MTLTSMLPRWILPLATLGALVAACGGSPTSDPTEQSSEALSNTATPSTDQTNAEDKLPGYCNVEYPRRGPLYETGYCVLEDSKATLACELVKAPQCKEYREADTAICACGSFPDCTWRDNVKCGPVE
jgi:hypothetical protein